MSQGSHGIDLADEAATRLLGNDVAAALAPGDVIALAGDLGAGKSTLARAIIRAIASDDGLDVPSPTFTLVQSYDLRVPVHHVDLYRLSSPDEIAELGLDELAATGVLLVEWPERAGGALPSATATITLSGDGEARHAEITGSDGFMARLARSLDIRAFLEAGGHAGARRAYLTGDASFRAYETVETRPGLPPVILMNAPRRPDGPPVRDGLPYSRIAHLAEDVVPFVAIDRVLREAGFAAPAIHAADFGAGLLLVEHLGGEGIVDAEGRPIAGRYIASAELLAAMHAATWPARIELANGVVHKVPPYDRAALGIETELLTDWYLPHEAGHPPDEATRREFAALWAEAFGLLDHAERSLVLRDFHSPNIIWRDAAQGTDRIGLIDFQDAVIGPAAYDVASLAMDARVTIEPALERRIVDAYCAARGADFDREAFAVAYAVMAAQRNTKILGIFVRLNVRDGKPGYLKNLPRIRDYLRRALSHPALDRLCGFYERNGIL